MEEKKIEKVNGITKKIIENSFNPVPPQKPTPPPPGGDNNSSSNEK